MESENSPQYRSDSPSLGNKSQLESRKVQNKSLEDFEEITNVPSPIDVTAQFLQFETMGRNKYNVDPLYNATDIKSSEDSMSTPNSMSQTLVQSSDTDLFGSTSSEILNPTESSLDEPLELIHRGNNLLQYDSSETKHNFDESLKEQTSDSFLSEENKLIELSPTEDISSGSDDISFIPKKGDNSPMFHTDTDKELSTPLKESLLNDGSDKPITTSMPVHLINTLSSDSDEKGFQGDGFHIKHNADDDTSDNDDFIPEPIPKDYPEIGMVEAAEFLSAIGINTLFHPELLPPKIESLVYWRDPKKSGIAFGSILIILLSLTTFSLISVVAHTSLLVLLAALGFRVYKTILQAVQKTSEGHPFKEYLDLDLTINQERAKEISESIVKYFNKSVTEFRRLFLVEDIVDSLKFACGLWCLTYLGSWFNGLSLIIIAFVGLFTLPKVYENNKAQIDANLNLVSEKINEISDKVRALIPVGKKPEEGKDKNE